MEKKPSPSIFDFGIDEDDEPEFEEMGRMPEINAQEILLKEAQDKMLAEEE